MARRNPIRLGDKGRGREFPSLTKRQRPPRLLSIVAAAALSITALANTAAQEATLCPDILYLIEQSRSKFLAVRGDADSDFGDYDTTLVLRDAWYCAILEDAEKTTYRCTWKYPQGDERAQYAFQQLAKEMRHCIGHLAEERTDRPVNHPDFYAAHYYQLPGGAVSVSLKNKAKLMSTLVSIRIDGFTEQK